MHDRPDPSRRRWLARAAASGGMLAAGPFASLALAGRGDGTAGRIAVVVLRGGMDGLGAVPAAGDASFAAARGPLADFGARPLPIDATFALHPNLVELHAMVGRREATVVHAVGLPYRERSHFDAQQVLESGGARPYELSTGWLGRALVATGRPGVALETAVPLLLRGKAGIDTWAPSVLPEPSVELVARLERLYVGDAELSEALQRARRLHLDGGLGRTAAASTASGASSPAMSSTGAMGSASSPSGAAGAAPARPPVFVTLARRAAEFLAAADGPQAAVLELGGWDTHANQTNPNGTLATSLRVLDAGLGALREELVASGAWGRTVVVVASEFGREVAVNGTLGTDHGSGGACFVLGGAVAGGRVVADWPGLGKADRHEGRDLRITTDLRAVCKGVLADHLEVATRTLDRDVFPGSAAVRPLELLRG